MTDAPDKLLTAQEAAALYGTTPKTLRRILIREGTPVQHLDGQYRIHKSVLLALKESQFKPIEKEPKKASS